MRQAVELDKDGNIVGVITVQNDADITRQALPNLVLVPVEHQVRIVGPKGPGAYHVGPRIQERDPDD